MIERQPGCVPVLRCSRGGDPGRRAQWDRANPRIAKTKYHKLAGTVTECAVRCLRFAAIVLAVTRKSVATCCLARGARLACAIIATAAERETGLSPDDWAAAA